MIYHAKGLKLRLGDMELDYIKFGRGARTLVMVQGLNTRGIKGSAWLLAHMYRIFAKEYTVYLFDRRPNVQEGITVQDMALDLATAMDALGLKGADVFGVSEGGMIAQYLAMDRPDLVRKLVLAVTLSRNNDTIMQVIDSWIEMAEKKAMRALIEDMARKMYSPAYVKKYRIFMPLLTLLQKPKDIGRFVILTKSCLTCDTYERLAEIKCPVFVIGAKGDQIVTGDASLEIAEKLGCKLHMYEDLGHAAYEEAKGFNQLVYDFFCE